jgi:hypothetical protein
VCQLTQDEFDIELSTSSKCTYVVSPDRRRSYPGTGVELPDVYGSRVGIDHNILEAHQPRAPAQGTSPLQKLLELVQHTSCIQTHNRRAITRTCKYTNSLHLMPHNCLANLPPALQ